MPLDNAPCLNTAAELATLYNCFKNVHCRTLRLPAFSHPNQEYRGQSAAEQRAH